MCLVTFSREPLIAEEDIVCYKQFYMYSSSGFMFTPIVQYRVAVPEDIPTIMDDTSKPVKIKNVPFGSTYLGKVINTPAYEISTGMIHAYTNPDLIVTNLTFYKKFKCIIPKGTRYYTGLNDDICAKKLLIIKQIV